MAGNDQKIATTAKPSFAEDVLAINALLGAMVGKKGGTETTSGGTTTKQTMLSAEAISGLLEQLMGGTGSAGYGKQGLSAIASGQKRAGMYNTSVNTQLVNDLMSRVSTEVAIQGAPTVVTKDTETRRGIGSQAGMVSNNGLLSLLAAGALSKGGRKKIGSLWEEFFGGESKADLEQLGVGLPTNTGPDMNMANLANTGRVAASGAGAASVGGVEGANFFDTAGTGTNSLNWGVLGSTPVGNTDLPGTVFDINNTSDSLGITDDAASVAVGTLDLPGTVFDMGNTTMDGIDWMSAGTDAAASDWNPYMAIATSFLSGEAGDSKAPYEGTFTAAKGLMDTIASWLGF